MSLRRCGFFLLAVLAGVTGRADFLITVGNHNLLANTPNQPIDIFMSSTLGSDPAISGMNFRATLGNGSGSQGVFNGTQGTLNGITFTGGGYFWDVAASTPIGQAPVLGGPAFADTSVNFNVPQSIGAGNSVRIATLKVDTTGLFSGTYAIDLLDLANVGLGPSQLLLPGVTNAVAAPGPGLFQVTNGTFQITAIPEPSSMMAGVVLALTGFSRMRRKRA